MIGYIKGTAEDFLDDAVIVECNGIGYRVFVPFGCASKISEGEEVKLYTYMSVKEDAINLYGFLTKDDLKMYTMLLGVSGVGPKAALGILSAMDADALRISVLSDDAASIAKAQGIGKKTAQKIILELKDKLDINDVLGSEEEKNNAFNAEQDSVSDAVLALTSLGYNNAESIKAVRKAAAFTGSDDPEVLLKSALKYLF